MPRRKNEGLIEVLITLPWQVSIVFAGIVYVGLKFVLPILPISNQFLIPFTKVVPGIAGYLALPFILISPLAYLNQLHRRKLLDEQVDIESLRETAWQDFELLVGEVYRRKGYQVTENGGAGPDGGIDLVLSKAGQKTIVQCKRWKQSQVGVTLVRELYGVMTAEKAASCIFVSSGKYSREAKQFAKGKPIELIDGSELVHMITKIKEDSGQISSKTRIELLEVNNSEDMKCPKCGSPMIERVARQGANAGNRFWGCTSYPRCRQIVSR